MEPNNGYLISQTSARPEEGPTSLQVNYDHRGSTTTNVVRPGVRRTFDNFITRTSITRHRQWSTGRQQIIGICVLALLVIFFILLLTIGGSSKCTNQSCAKICLTEECVQTASSLLSAMDRTAEPCTDFFQYACGTWNRMHVITEDRSAFSTFDMMADKLQVILKGLLEELPGSKDNSATLKAKNFYKSCMDIQKIRDIGDRPLRQALEQLGGWPVVMGNSWPDPGNGSLENLLGQLRGDFNVGVIVEAWIGPDDKNSSANILQFDQMQLALPSRDYYLSTNMSMQRDAYLTYMTNVAELLGANRTQAMEDLAEVLKLEQKFANASLPEADRHDPSVLYHKMKLRDLQRKVPEMQWLLYLRKFLNSSLTDQETIVTYATSYLIEMGRIISQTSRRTLHNYALWRLVNSMMPHMIDKYQAQRLEFHKILLGISSERERWSRCVEWTNKKLGMAVGALFIRDNFDHESKETALEMIHTLREAFNELLRENDWMDDDTKKVAKEKADRINERIGYPEFLKDPVKLSEEYDELNITSDRFLENIFAVAKFDAFHNLKDWRKPVDKNRWSTEPAIVNAFYNPNTNDIVFPAGILQPMFYSQHMPKSLNYGGIGVVIGHEITHGFDDKGRQFDQFSTLSQWWNNATIRAFRNRTQCIIDQYDRYKMPEVDEHVNGRMTQGENIADNGGLKQSFRAYKKWVASHGEEPLLPGLNLTHDQLFFLNYAQIWCGTMRPQDAVTKLSSGVHPPGPVRVLGPLANSHDFARAYNCPEGSPMNPTKKCIIWLVFIFLVAFSFV
ncbi:hypothetical protein QAD02_015327 [Eretmocerus hayati]|uniref:Uncharacterized protein n=1 Tax=Eretmocerus hayati TaxID=131215 RepID=A0ACC2P7H2_9HYME|nr:hypothetical protein QAD02_015327 [Eretmocerus hayati]